MSPPLAAAAAAEKLDSADQTVPISSTTAVADGLRKLYERGELCDMTLLASGERFPAHQAMVAAMSPHFRSYLQQLNTGAATNSEGATLMAGLLKPPPAAAVPPQPAAATEPPQPAAATEAVPLAAEAAPSAAEAIAACTAASPAKEEEAPTTAEGAPETAAPKPARGSHLELDVTGLQSSESVKIMLDYMYCVSTSAPWEYEASSLEANRDVLRLAQHFNLPHLHEYAARWLAKGLGTANAVSRLVICEDLGLSLLRDKIIEQLTAHPAALTMVCTSPEIMQHPKILQDLLIQVASVNSNAEKEKAKKEQEKADKEREKAEKEKEKAEKAEQAKAEKEKAEKEKENQAPPEKSANVKKEPKEEAKAAQAGRAAKRARKA